MDATERIEEIDALTNTICDIRGVDPVDRPDYRYLAQQIFDRGWRATC